MKICPRCDERHAMSGKFCSRSCANARVWSQESNDKRSITQKSKPGYVAAPSRMTQGSEELKRRQKEIQQERWTNPELRQRMSDHATRRMLGGTTSRQTIEYHTQNGVVYLQSSYELEVAKSLDTNDVEWIRPPHVYWYDGTTRHRYHPDFYLPEYNVYLDPKNDYLAELDRFKIDQASSQNNIRVLILLKDECNWDSIKRNINCLGSIPTGALVSGNSS